jgi:integrase
LRFSQTHRLRHTRATELLNDGVPIHVVQRYLGHKSPEMTMRYANPRELHQMGAFLQVAC